jgi:RNA polymerase sigma-70 factor, ECF subfamily
MSAIDQRHQHEKMSDEEILRLLAEDPRSNFTYVVNKYVERLHTFARRLVGSEAEDVVQQTMLNVMNVLQRWPRERILTMNLQAYLYATARNLCKGILKKRNLQISFPVDDSEEDAFEHFPNLIDEWGTDAITDESHEAVVEAIGRLPKRFRNVNFLYYIADLKYKDIARILEIPESTAKSHVHRMEPLLIQLVTEMMKE